MKKQLLAILLISMQLPNSAIAFNIDNPTSPKLKQQETQGYRTINEPELSFILHLPGKREWFHAIQQRPSTTALVLNASDNMVQPLGLEIFTLDHVHITEKALLPNAVTSTLSSARKLGILNTINENDLQKVQYGKLKGYTYKAPFQFENNEYSTMIFTGILGDSTPLHAIFSSTDENLQENEYSIYKILSMIKKKP